MRRWIARTLTLALAAGVVETVAVADPAWACGCGAYIPSNGTASVAKEQAIVRFDGTTEDVVMRFSVHSDAADAAWVMPVPGPAKVTLGDKQLFNALDAAMEPRVVVRKHFIYHHSGLGLGGSAAAPPAVRVLSDQRIGDFEVANLAASDPQALDSWLSAHDFKLKPGTADRLKAYIAEGWQYVAVRLASGSSHALDGALDPIRISFASSKAVYPMRLSAGAATPQSVELAVLAPHRMDVVQEPDPTLTSRATFGDWIDPSSVQPALADLAAGRMFLTVYDQYFQAPAQISQDYELGQAKQDWIDHPVYYQDEQLHWVGMPAYIVAFVVAPLGFALIIASILVFRRRRRTAAG